MNRPRRKSVTRHVKADDKMFQSGRSRKCVQLALDLKGGKQLCIDVNLITINC